MKNKPNSNLLTIADSPFQHHFIILFLYLYIYREIQMVLGTSIIKAESTYHNPVRSVPFSTTLCVPFRAVWRRKRGHEADGRGNLLAGGERGGKSHITYKPYGEILRTDSFGPDISKYKYTGQEEDRESGLMYYKARYYDAKIGRFLQQDSMAFPNQVNGMNRMMYVDGNPVGYRDPSGNSPDLSLITSIAAQLTQPMSTELVVMAMFTKGKGARAIQDIALAQMAYQFLSGQDDFGLSSLDRLQQWNLLMVVQARGNIGKRISEAFRRIGRSMDHSVKGSLRGISGTLKAMNKGTSDGTRKIGRAIDGGARWLASGGSYSRNNGNDLDHFYGEFGIDTNGLFRSIERSDVGRAVTHLNKEPCISFVAAVAFALSPAGEMLGALGAAKFGKDAWDIYSFSNGGSQAAGCIQSMDWSLSVPASSL